ncbi:biofilm development regulator YmgB/AriR family protein [Cronobacter malonaticus]
MKNSLCPVQEAAKDIATKNGNYLSEKELISKIRLELAHKNQQVTNKDIILSLIYKLQAETDVVKQSILRNALELVVRQTPDDIYQN